jgi:glutathione S-transferase
VRHIIYEKGLENEFDIVSPSQLGGLGSEQYVALNPQNKMPLLLLPNGQSLPESEVGVTKEVCIGCCGFSRTLQLVRPAT